MYSFWSKITWMAHIWNDLSILDLKRKADPLLSASKTLKHFYCFKEWVKLSRSMGLISNMTFYGWLVRNCGSLSFSFPASDIYPAPFISAAESQVVGCSSHRRGYTWMWWPYKQDFPWAEQEYYLAVQCAVGLQSFCSMLLAALCYKAIGGAVREGGVIKDAVFPPTPNGTVS